MVDLFLFPLDPVVAVMGGKPVVDEHFKEEHDYIKSQGLPVVLFDHDAAVSGSGKLLHGPLHEGTALMRGYMLTVEQYDAFHFALVQEGIELVTTPEQYEAAHHFPSWYDLVKADTAQAVWSVGDVAPDTSALPSGKGVIKDYVKSLKHDPEATVIGDVHDHQEVERVVSLFVERREGVQGGIVVREFKNFEDAEWRTWWSYGQPVDVTCHPDTDGIEPTSPPPLNMVAKAMRAIGSPLGTADFAKDEHGHWFVVEIGDGQVSDRPRSVETERLLEVFVAE